MAQTPEVSTEGPISDLHFNDIQLQRIATRLIRQARARGIDSSSGRDRVERLLSLEARLNAPPDAMGRVDVLVSRMTQTEVGRWAEVRRGAETQFGKRHDETGDRIRDLLWRWQRRKFVSITRYLSSNYRSPKISGVDWERRFNDFLQESPRDAAAWGWLVSREYGSSVREQYGRVDAEASYRFYLELSGLGTAQDAREIFSVPGVANGEDP